MPQSRTQEYAVWKACERFGVLPPGVLKNWEEMLPWHQAMLLAFNQIRENEEFELATAMAGVNAMKGML